MSRRAGWTCLALLAVICVGCARDFEPTGDRLRDLQTAAVTFGEPVGFHWGPDPDVYVSFHGHTNRLMPVYTFGTRGGGPGLDLDDYTGEASLYRDPDRLVSLYGRLPDATLDPAADWMDQTDLAAIQRAALAAGRSRVILVVFDGMDWHMTRAAAIHAAGAVDYEEGRGSGLHLQDYTAGGSSQFGWMVTSPHDDRIADRVDDQQIHNLGIGLSGGYDAGRGGRTPWAVAPSPGYLNADDFRSDVRHAITDSAAAATAMCAGIKTFNYAVNVAPDVARVETVAHEAQRLGYAIGVVTSVPISHATPAAAYAHNVTRKDYQDLTRDLLGLPSISHPDEPLPGVDVLIGAGAGVERKRDRRQGANFVPGNRFITSEDLGRIDRQRGGRYIVATRVAGRDGGEVLAEAAAEAVAQGARLFGLYGVPDDGGHFPYRTADGRGEPAPGRKGEVESYDAADRSENPTLAEATRAALTVLEARGGRFWMMLEAGDVDWASHDANLDNAIGAVLDGDAAVRVVTDWVEAHGGWDDALMIVTGDHGHYLVIDRPQELLSGP